MLNLQAGLADDGTMHEREIFGVLEWLWDTIVQPVLSLLGYTEGATKPRLWWYPTGLISFLPIHAAGYQNGPSAMDYVVSGYTSSIKALKYSRDNIGSSGQNQGLIVVMPTTQNYPDLQGARNEAGKVKKLTRGHFTLDAVKVSPSKEELGKAVEGKTFVHFVCHAQSNESDPSSSGLILKDGAMTVAEINQMRFGCGSLAYLSACHTALSRAPDLEDEVITLTSAFRVAGFARIVGTLWSAEDKIGCQVAEEFYAKLGGDVGKSLEALHHAVLVQREKNPEKPSLWASYIYTGA